MQSPLQEDICTVPGVGEASARKLADAGFKTTFQLLGKFLTFAAPGTTTRERCDNFCAWLAQIGVTANKHTIVLSLADAINHFIPNLYNPDEL